MECCSMRFQQETSSLHMAPQFLHCVVTMPQLLLTKLTMHHAAWFLLPMFCSSLAHQKTKNVFQTNWNCSTCEPSKSSKISLKSKYQPKKRILCGHQLCYQLFCFPGDARHPPHGAPCRPCHGRPHILG